LFTAGSFAGSIGGRRRALDRSRYNAAAMARTPSNRRRIAVAIACGALLVLGSEAVFFLASADPPAPPPGTSCAVLVLGYPSARDGSPSAVQRSRVAEGVDALRRFDCDRLVLSGGAVHDAFVEADVMARAAEELGVDAASVVRERQARNTWENVALSLPFLADRGAIYVASEPLHARRGVRYLCRQRPELCARAHPVAAYAPLARAWWRPGAALYEGFAWLRDETARGGSG
jgi:vancomycin permeability regulator SanA